MSDSKLESKELWVRIEGIAEYARKGLENRTPGSRINLWDQFAADFSQAVLELKAQQSKQGKLLARQAMESMGESE